MASRTYKIHAADNAAWLTTAAIVERLKKAFAAVTVDAEAGRRHAQQFVESYKRLMEAGLGGSSATPLSAVEHMWKGVPQVWLWEVGEKDPSVYFFAMNQAPIVVAFTKTFPSRRRRSMVNRIARVLGYKVESSDE